MYDVIIIGGGAAGLTAGIYASRAKLKTLVIESAVSQSQITTTDIIENYPGFPEGISGFELIEKFRQQALRFGLEIATSDVQSIAKTQDNGWQVTTYDATYPALSVIVATGASYTKLGIPGEEEFTGRGVSYCATCDAPFYRDKDVVVIGGGDAAIQEAIFLTKFAKKVTLVHRRDRLRATALLQEKAFANERISFVWDCVVEKISGDNAVNKVRLKNLKDPDKSTELITDGVFIFAGLMPNTEIVRELVDVNEKGYILVDAHMRTSKSGIFACGDCTEKLLRQVITACGDGATAAFAAQHYVEELKGISYDKPKTK
jgi:thioredoxin reductase (NADPH)